MLDIDRADSWATLWMYLMPSAWKNDPNGQLYVTDILQQFKTKKEENEYQWLIQLQLQP